LTVVATSSAARAVAREDAYVAGYAAAVLERELKLSAPSLRVENGVVTIAASDLGGADRAAVIETLSRVPGAARVEIVDVPGAPSTPAAPTAAPAPPTPAPPTPLRVLRELQPGVFPGGQLFDPLVADPRWPHFAASYQRYLNERQLQDVAAVSFGETLTFYRSKIGSAWWETGIQAGVFAVFDLDAASKDLVNADYFAAVFGAYRYGKLSALARVFHQSSHLGDEFLLRGRVKNRVNLSYESVDAKLSYDLVDDVLRIYGGGGYLFDQEPQNIAPGSVQGGLELKSPWPGPSAKLRPIAAADLQSREENSWHTDLSLRAGVQIEGLPATRNLQILLEYFRGHSPNGQFFKEKLDYIGLGAHFHF
jgi:hypothetical protein